tara:strand:+ start:10567 stop:11442 length:876 start_codon:yes stop_codon:yes gene_type:complete
MKNLSKRKGIILSGGLGTRLYPATKVISKQLLPIYDKPMIFYSLSVLMLAGIKDILLISDPINIGVYQKLLGDGSNLNIKIEYKIQEEPRGLADAFILGEKFINSSDVALILGDNLFYGSNLSQILKKADLNSGATIFGYHVSDPERFGVVEFNKDHKAINIEEKPSRPKSNYAVTGLYFYDNDVVDYAKSLSPSDRGEIEITDLNNIYLSKGNLNVELLGRGIAWLDTGTYKSMLEASNFVSSIVSRQALQIACLEEISFKNGWMTDADLLRVSKMPENKYQMEYLKNLL